MFYPLLKILFIFGIMLTGIRLKLGIGLSILLGSLICGLIFGLSPGKTLLISTSSLLDLKLLLLILIILLIMVLSEVMEITGQSQKMMQQVSNFLVWPKLRLIFFPALIGMLPMPGGAVFSAPLVKNAAQDLNLRNSQKTFINYWFRHIWELTWPLYPGIILAAYLAQMSILKLISYTWPSLFITLFLGWIFFLNPRHFPQLPKKKKARNEQKDLISALKAATPLLLAVLGTLFLQGMIWLSGLSLPSEIGFILALSGAIQITLRQNKLKFKSIIPYFYKKHVLQMLFTIISIFVFKGILDQGGIVKELAQGSEGSGALVATAMFLPLLVGMISGITMAFVGSTFPLLFGIMEHLGISNHVPYVILALFSGYAGVMASPVHICFLLTCDYFQTNVSWAWTKILWPSLLFLAAGFIYYLILL